MNIDDLNSLYCNCRSQLQGSGSELAAEQVRRVAYVTLLEFLAKNECPVDDIGELCHKFLYLEELNQRLHFRHWTPMAAPGEFGKFLFARHPDKDENEFYELRFFDLKGNELRCENQSSFTIFAIAVTAAKELLLHRHLISEHLSEKNSKKVAVIAISVHGAATVRENTIVWYSDLSCFK